ncbi:MAG: LysM peptidoglycan-binding domain-containing protein [Proteobacteria bacterium]|nr:LysM peptidoglycan-binding domain-containing protein [Pseudomonadota bacterium]
MENTDNLLSESQENPDTMAMEPGEQTGEQASDMEEMTMPTDGEPPSGVNSESTVHYTVKKGDTLWDLSQRFNNSAWKWPGMWSDNKQLTNPHRIYPGQKIKLFFRSDIERIKKIQAKAAEEKMVTETVEVAPEVVEPDETEKTVEAVEPVKIDDTADNEGDNVSDLKLPFYHYSKIGGIGFMTPEPSVDHGYIFKLKGSDRLMISKGDEVFIKEDNKKTLIPGAKYFCYELLDPSFVKNRIKEESNLFKLGRKVKKTKVGYQHLITGVIQITSKKSGYAVGTVIQSYKTIGLKNFLIPYTYRSPDITLSASVEGLTGSIIASEEGEGIFGDDKIAFIDKGSKDGVKDGQMYNIFYPEEKGSAELLGGKKLFVPVDFASFLVLHTDDTASTVLITSAYQGVSSGDMWHYPLE